MIDTTLASDNPLLFRNNLFEKSMKGNHDDKIREQKRQYNIKYMQKYVQYSKVKFINMKTLQPKKHYFPVKVKLYTKLSFFTLL